MPVENRNVERDIRKHGLPEELDLLNEDVDKLTEIVQLAAAAIAGLNNQINDLQQRVNFLEDYQERVTGKAVPKP